MGDGVRLVVLYALNAEMATLGRCEVTFSQVPALPLNAAIWTHCQTYLRDNLKRPDLLVLALTPLVGEGAI